VLSQLEAREVTIDGTFDAVFFQPRDSLRGNSDVDLASTKETRAIRVVHVHVNFGAVKFDCVFDNSRFSLVPKCVFRIRRQFASNLLRSSARQQNPTLSCAFDCSADATDVAALFRFSPTGFVITLQREKLPKLSQLLVCPSELLGLFTFASEHRMC
jgi:hypothetical protein